MTQVYTGQHLRFSAGNPVAAGHKHLDPRKSGLLRVRSPKHHTLGGKRARGKEETKAWDTGKVQTRGATRTCPELRVKTFGITAQGRPQLVLPPAVYMACK